MAPSAGASHRPSAERDGPNCASNRPTSDMERNAPLPVLQRFGQSHVCPSADDGELVQSVSRRRSRFSRVAMGLGVICGTLLVSVYIHDAGTGVGYRSDRPADMSEGGRRESVELMGEMFPRTASSRLTSLRELATRLRHRWRSRRPRSPPAHHVP